MLKKGLDSLDQGMWYLDCLHVLFIYRVTDLTCYQVVMER